MDMAKSQSIARGNAALQAASPESVLARRVFALETARSFWRRHGRVVSVTLDVALAARIDAFLLDLWAGQRRAAMAALGHAARHVRNENALVPVARFLMAAGAAAHQAALAALAYALRHTRDDDKLLPAASQALDFLSGRNPATDLGGNFSGHPGNEPAVPAPAHPHLTPDPEYSP
jgi:FAD/FMN-containing dehydrogenase